MADYIWELGIDWEAVQTGGVGYLRSGLTKNVNTPPEPDLFMPVSGTEPTSSGVTIVFKIFDLRSNPSAEPPVRKVAKIWSFVILTQAAVQGQSIGNPLDSLQPAIQNQDPTSALSKAFGHDYYSWTTDPVKVTPEAASKRFLLTVQLQATGTDGVTRFFSHDPEMAVGPNG